MLGVSDARHFRRLVAGFCLIAAPAVLLIGALIHPQSQDDPAAHLAVVGESPGRYYVAHAIVLAGLVLFVPAILGLMHLLRERATGFGHVGGGLLIIGLFGAAAVVAVDGIAISEMGRAGANAEEMAALLDRIRESAGLRIFGGIGAFSFLIGGLLLAFGLWRAGAVQPWIAGGIAVANIVLFIGQLADNRTIIAIAGAIALIAFGAIGWRILTESDEQWARQAAAA
ncbi:MAG: hypothetical protein M3N24_01625 [Actinomycetota bacterium]|nr:hypothetical protein [Actinomycetota bacterium]